MAFSWRERQAAIDDCRARPAELLIVGGGVVGCSIAAHAALLGLDCVLVEREDFAAGASGNSTGLAHAGLRYLAQGRIGYVWREARERLLLEQLAPHWVRPFPFLFPVYRGDPFGLGLIRLATIVYSGLYRLAAVGLGIPVGPSYRMRTAAEILQRVPGLDPFGLTGGMEYFVDAQLADSRLTVGFAQQAASFRARIMNHAELVSWTRDRGRLTGGIVRDEVGQSLFTVRARQIINATGAWIDEVRRSAGLEQPLLQNSKGVHLITDRIAETPLILSGEVPGQVLFVIPAGRNLSLVGTTDTPYSAHPDQACWTWAEVTQLLRSLFRCFPDLQCRSARDSAARFDRYVQDHVHAVFWGLRPLILQHARSTLDTSREFRLIREENGLWSVPGVKLTAGRRAGEQVARAAWKTLRRSPAPRRRLTRLPGGNIGNLPAYLRDIQSLHPAHSDAQLSYLIGGYGSRCGEVLDCADRHHATDREPVLDSEPWLYAEAVYAARQEMVLTLNDFLWRRTGWARRHDLPDAAVWRIAEILGQELRWPPQEIGNQVEAFQRKKRVQRLCL